MTRCGLENRLMDIYRNIDRTNIQFDFLTFRKESGYFDEEIKSLGGKVYYANPLTLPGVCSGRVNRELSSFFLKHTEYKIVHTHLNQWCGVVLKSAKHANVPVRIAHSRNSYGNINIKNITRNIIKLSTNRYATHKFAVSQKAGNWLFGKKAINSGKVTIWPNAIDCGKFRYNTKSREKMRSELGLTDAFTLIHVGRLNIQKNHLFLIDIFDNLINKVPNSKLLLVGDDQMHGQCQKYASKKRSANNIKFLGARSDIADLLQAGDVFVFPSLYEGFPGAVLEAQASGLPCVISDTVTNEVCLTDNIVQLPVNQGIDIWVKKILDFKNILRSDRFDVLAEKGYDIHTLCRTLTKFYENASQLC